MCVGGLTRGRTIWQQCQWFRNHWIDKLNLTSSSGSSPILYWNYLDCLAIFSKHFKSREIVEHSSLFKLQTVEIDLSALLIWNRQQSNDKEPGGECDIPLSNEATTQELKRVRALSGFIEIKIRRSRARRQPAPRFVDSRINLLFPSCDPI